MVYAFEGFELDAARVELRRDGEVLALEPKTYDLLLFFLQNRDRLLAKDEILDQVWPGVFVTEASLSGAVKQVRKALGDDGRAQKFVKTVHGKGFRFVADVAQTVDPVAAAPAPPEQGVPAPAGPPAIAVLPFNLLGTDPAHAALSEALPTELIATLSRLRHVKVIARGSAFRFGPDNVDFGDVALRLGAAYALTGSVELAAGRLMVMVELCDTQSHAVIWSDTHSGALDDVFAIRQAIAQAVSTAVEARVPLHEAELLAHVPSDNLDAWGLYHLGVRHLYRFNRADNDAARIFFERATGIDPGFARAVAGLSYTEFENYNLGFGAEKTAHRARALDLAERAVDLDPFDPFCNLVLGRAKWIHQDPDAALSWVGRSIDLNPNYAFALYNSGKLNAITCEGAAAEDDVAAALTLSPLDPHLQSMLSARALAAFVRDEPYAAVDHAARSVRAPNAHLFVCVIAAAIFETYGESARARQATEQVARLATAFSKDHFYSLFSLRDPGRQAAFAEALDRLQL